MRITRNSFMSGKLHTMDIPVTPAELDAYYAGSANVQDCFPHLTAEQREFIKSGITPEEWATLSDEDDESERTAGRPQMNELLSPNPDAIFWVGNKIGAALVNYTTGRTYALITKLDDPYDVRLARKWHGSPLHIWRWNSRVCSRLLSRPIKFWKPLGSCLNASSLGNDTISFGLRRRRWRKERGRVLTAPCPFFALCSQTGQSAAVITRHFRPACFLRRDLPHRSPYVLGTARPDAELPALLRFCCPNIPRLKHAASVFLLPTSPNRCGAES
jgi:hypothetical protein